MEEPQKHAPKDDLMSELKARLNKKKDGEPFVEVSKADKPSSGMSDLELLLKGRKRSLPNIKEAPALEPSQPEFLSHQLKPVSKQKQKKPLSKVEEDEEVEFHNITLRKVSTSSISSLGSLSVNGSHVAAPSQDAELKANLSQRRKRMTERRTDESADSDEEVDAVLLDNDEEAKEEAEEPLKEEAVKPCNDL